MLLVATLNASLTRNRGIPALVFCKLWWVDPDQHQHSPPSRTRESIGGAKARKFIGWDKGSLVGEGKRRKTSEANKIAEHLPQADCCPASLNSHLGSPKPNCFFLHPSFYCWTCHGMVWNIPLAGSRELCWLCLLPASCPPWAYLLLGGGMVRVGGKKENALMFCKHCSAVAKTS